MADLDVIESNEAFAAQACAVSQQLDFDPEKVCTHDYDVMTCALAADKDFVYDFNEGAAIRIPLHTVWTP